MNSSHAVEDEFVIKIVVLANSYLKSKDTAKCTPAIRLLVLIRALHSLTKVSAFKNCDINCIKLKLEAISRFKSLDDWLVNKSIPTLSKSLDDSTFYLYSKENLGLG